MALPENFRHARRTNTCVFRSAPAHQSRSSQCRFTTNRQSPSTTSRDAGGKSDSAPAHRSRSASYLRPGARWGVSAAEMEERVFPKGRRPSRKRRSTLVCAQLGWRLACPPIRLWLTELASCVALPNWPSTRPVRLRLKSQIGWLRCAAHQSGPCSSSRCLPLPTKQAPLIVEYMRQAGSG